MRHLLWALPVVVAGLAACQGAGPGPGLVAAGDLPPITPDYRKRIATWASEFYAEPRSLRGTQISDPVLMRDRTGRLLWLVCIEADARAAGGGYMGPQRQAFGFAPNYFLAPLERNNATLVRQDCDASPLIWRPWPELQRR